MILDRIDEAHDLRGGRFVALDGRRRDHRDLRGVRLDPRGRDRVLERHEVRRAAGDLPTAFGFHDVLRPRFERELHDLLFRRLVTGDEDEAAARETERHRSRLAEIAARLLEDLAHLGARCDSRCP